MTTPSFAVGPYSLIGDTISGAPQPRVDSQGTPIPGAFSAPSLADVRPLADPDEQAATAELFRAAPEVLAQRDDLARRLGDAINYIEHGIAHRAGVTDSDALLRLLDREVLAGFPLKAAYGNGVNHSEASFDIVAAKAAVEIARNDPKAGQLASYSELLDIVAALASRLDHAIESHIYSDPRDAIGSPEEQLVKQAFTLIKQPYEARRDNSPAP